MKSKIEIIKAAAIKRSDGVIVFGKDHSECILKSPLGTCKEGSVQGFVTQSGRFVDRVLAGKIAFHAKQILHPPHKAGIISEQIWSSGPCGYNPETGYYFEKTKSKNTTEELEDFELCLVCGKPVEGYEPQFCCSGHECGCMGMPTEPPICSDECWKGFWKSKEEEEEKHRKKERPIS